uniref:Caspase-3 n=1 Tax=Mamestra brassicae TaxID=55057 RepID=G0XQG1_MAMBR|nr:caspase-3 [Mamestra brassicae]
MENMEETSPDVKGFNLKPSNTSNPQLVPDEGLKFDKDALYYDMSGEKYLIILNQHTFKKTIFFKNQQPTTRNGTDNDVKSLKKVFGNLGFKDQNIIVFRDLEYEGIIKNLTAIATQDHSKTSCICVTILTHGDKGGEVHAADRPYLLTDVIAIFEKQRSLVNKPKLFFVQACRGGSMDAGNTVSLDSQSDSVLTIPTHADFLVLCSTVEDYLSYRDMNGSWMIQALCHIIHTITRPDLLHMITFMTVWCIRKSTYTPFYMQNNKKQMPETRFTLTKLWFDK